MRETVMKVEKDIGIQMKIQTIFMDDIRAEW
jgi:hypothetical protein